MADSIERLAFELISGALNEQERILSGLRACAGMILGASSVAGSFLASGAGKGALSIWSLLATVAFGSCVASTIVVLLPRGLVFAFGGDTLLADGDPLDARDVCEAYRAAGRWIEPHVQENRRKLNRIGHWLTLSCAMLAAEVILWTLSVRLS
ncbi:MAG TPA: hypothetical protein VHT25_02655 [Solirubrobacteraceae bacterium]|jgi:hypothetical protein|nr:hypothetical protein [Solirubrobacteraceae bacterium]